MATASLAMRAHRATRTSVHPKQLRMNISSTRTPFTTRTSFSTWSDISSAWKGIFSTRTPVVHKEEDTYQFSRGRFLQNETSEMASRRVHFDVDRLKVVAAAAVGAPRCIHMEKVAGGLNNQVLLLKMNTGQEVIAKIPFPAAGRPHYTTASEVATMDFMRNELGLPVPKVYASCSRVDWKGVRAEYIIMEKAAGVPVSSVWYDMETGQRVDLIWNLSKIQQKWSSASYDGYGSIYHASDLPSHCRLPCGASERFALGPATGRDWLDHGRMSITLDRGPWTTLEGYLDAIGQREFRCVEQLERLPPPRATLCGPNLYQPTRQKKFRALGYYHLLLRHLQPTDPVLTNPTAWHKDLDFHNIYVDPLDPGKISGIIDWQSTEVAPHFSQVRRPFFVAYGSPAAPDQMCPELPPDWQYLSPSDQAAAWQVNMREMWAYAYRYITQKHASHLWKCLEFQGTEVGWLLHHAGGLLVEGEAVYTATVFDYAHAHGLLEQDMVPESAADSATDHRYAQKGDEQMSVIRELIGEDLFPENGWVKEEFADEAKEALQQCKKLMVKKYARTAADRAAWAESWPFDD